MVDRTSVPVELVTGFLGSGKTTLINRMLRDPLFAGSMVVVNEFGEIGLDNLLMATAEDNVLLLQSGCMCCAASGALRDTLIDLYMRRAKGSIPPFRNVIIETSGLAHPGPIVAALVGDSALKTRFHLVRTTTLVDVVNGLDTLDKYEEAQRQVAFADQLLMTKCDLVDEAAIDRVHQRVSEINESADVQLLHPHEPLGNWLSGGDPVYSPKSLRATGRLNAGGYEGLLARRSLPAQYANTEDPARGHGQQFTSIRSCAFTVEGSLDWSGYAAWTAALSAKLGKRLLRCKGVLTAGPDKARWVVQGVQGYFAPPIPVASPMKQPDFVVCIVERLTAEDRELIHSLEDSIDQDSIEPTGKEISHE